MSAPESRVCSCGPEGFDLCECGHTDYWHALDGQGDCEHDGECSCVSFAPWTNMEHFSDCDGEWPCSCTEDAKRPTPEPDSTSTFGCPPPEEEK